MNMKIVIIEVMEIPSFDFMWDLCQNIFAEIWRDTLFETDLLTLKIEWREKWFFAEHHSDLRYLEKIWRSDRTI